MLCVTSSMSLGWGLWGAFPSQGHTQLPRAALPEGLVLQGLGEEPSLSASICQTGISQHFLLGFPQFLYWRDTMVSSGVWESRAGRGCWGDPSEL